MEKELARRKAEREVREEFARRNQRRKELKAAIRREKYGGVLKKVSKVGSATVRAAKYIDKKTQPKRRPMSRKRVQPIRRSTYRPFRLF